MTPEFKVDFERGAKSAWTRRCSARARPLTRFRRSWTSAESEDGSYVAHRLDQSKYEALLARHAPIWNLIPSLAPPSWRPICDARHGASGDRHGRNLRSAGRSGSRADFGLRRATVSRICRYRRRRPWRLLEKIEDIRSSPIVIVAAGMDAALVSVVGGLVSSPVIALPTSVGYGVALGGAAALHAALASCAPGISVVNIDNGYGAACAALRISRFLSASQASVDRIAYGAAFPTAT